MRATESGMKTLAEFRAVYALPLMELVLRAAEVHKAHRGHTEIQRCVLLSIKTGGCPEDCTYCSQSAHYDSPVGRQPLVTVDEVREKAERAKAGARHAILHGGGVARRTMDRSSIASSRWSASSGPWGWKHASRSAC